MRAVLRCNSINSRRYASALHMTATLARASVKSALSHPLIVPVFATLIGMALRVFHIGAQSLWLDELFSVLVSRRDLAGVINGTMQGDTNPPLFAVLLHIALQFGSDETAARLTSFILGLACIPVMYLLACELFDRQVAQIACMMLALNPLHIFYAQEARMYALLAFCELTAFIFFARAWRSGGVLNWAAFSIATACAFYAHNLAALYLLAIDIFAVTQPSVLRKRWHRLLIAHLAVFILFLPWVPILLQQLQRVQLGFWESTPSILVLFTTPYLFIFGPAVPLPVVPVALFAALASVALGLIAGIHAIRGRVDSGASLGFVVVVFVAPILLLYLVSFVRPIFVERTLLPASFGLFALTAWAIVHSKSRGLQIGIAAVGLATTLFALNSYYFDTSAQKPAMREVAQDLKDQIEPGDAVAHTSDYSALAFEYYAPELPNAFIAGDADYTALTTRARSGLVAGLQPMSIDRIVENHNRVWLVVALDHNQEYQLSRIAELDRLGVRVRTLLSHSVQMILFDMRANTHRKGLT